MGFDNNQGSKENLPVPVGIEGAPDAEYYGAYEQPESFRATLEPEGAKARKLPLPAIIAIIVVVALVVAFAFYWEATREAELEEPYEAPPNYPPQGRSVIQDQLNELYWIDKDFLPINDFSRPGTLLNDINGIVIHNIGNPNTTAQQNRNYFANLADTQETYASSNFIICLDGSIVQCVPVDEIAYASHHRNDDTLSIELCHPDETGEFTEETYASAVRLTAWLSVRYGLSADDIIRHFDVVRSDGSQKGCPAYFVENEEAWEAFRSVVAETIRLKMVEQPD